MEAVRQRDSRSAAIDLPPLVAFPTQRVDPWLCALQPLRNTAEPLLLFDGSACTSARTRSLTVSSPPLCSPLRPQLENDVCADARAVLLNTGVQSWSSACVWTNLVDVGLKNIFKFDRGRNLRQKVFAFSNMHQLLERVSVRMGFIQHCRNIIVCQAYCTYI